MKNKRFSDVNPKQDFIELEQGILQYWEESDAFKKLQQKNAGGKPWSFFDGPITANNSMGVHHGWGRSLKDAFQRFKAMQGFDQRWQNGFDCQGLWVEVEVEKDLGFNSKWEIEAFGLDKFAKANRDRVLKYSKLQTEQSKRLGQWMDWDHSYYTYSDTNIEYIWHFLQTVSERGWLKKGHKSMPWCARCGTSLSQHELADAYKEVVHESVYFRLPVVNKKDEYFLVWTTTPWTVPVNVAVAVNPVVTYVRAKQGDDTYIVAKAVAARMGDFKVLSEMTGQQLLDENLRYRGPYDDVSKLADVKHTLIPWDMVGEDEGTGLVHIAPGAGEEDFQLGKQFGLPVLSPLDENGVYGDGYGWLTGRKVADVKKDIFGDLRKKGAMFKIKSIKHRYPHCWRCKQELVFRISDEWFIAADDIRQPMKDAAATVTWKPESVGKRMQDWLNNMGDWNISRKRFWGLPLPFYLSESGELYVVGSRKELRELAVEPEKVDALSELHRPWIDEIEIKSPKTGDVMRRVPDVGDCWLDAGIVPFSTLKYFEDRSYWQKWFPAQFICEMREQVRLWFYATLFMAVTLENKTPYKSVLAYEKVYDEKGKPMHKSAGNAIWFDDGVEEMGADVMRWLYAAQNPGMNLRFGYEPANEVRRKVLLWWNAYSFFVTYANIDNWTLPTDEKLATFTPKYELDRWILSLVNSFIKSTTADFEVFETPKVMARFEKLIVSLANWYVRRSRRRFWKSSNDPDKEEAYITMYVVLLQMAKAMAPTLPFITEAMYQNLRRDDMPESVHHCRYPKVREDIINAELNTQMATAIAVTSLGRAAREQAKIKVRQPLAEALVYVPSQLSKSLQADVAAELNVKKIVPVANAQEIASRELKLNFAVAGKKYGAKVPQLKKLLAAGKVTVNDDGTATVGDIMLDAVDYVVEYSGLEDYVVESQGGLVVALNANITEELKQEGLAREIVRAVQDLRKETGLNVADRISLYVDGDQKFRKVAEIYKDYIAKETLATSVEVDSGWPDVDKETRLELDGVELKIGLSKA